MKITILAVGKTNKNFVGHGVDEYVKRLNRYIRADLVILPDIKNSKNLSVEQLIQKEEGPIMDALNNCPDIILLDETGKECTSVELSEILQSKMLSGSKELLFVIGGAYGVSSLIKQRVRLHLALSRLTFSHQMVRLILTEQLYRAMTIIKGEPYHHE